MGYSRSTSLVLRSASITLTGPAVCSEIFAEVGGFDSLGLSLADASPISRRDLSQASLVDAMVSGYWQGWRISGPDRAVVRLVGVRGFAFADPWLGARGVPGYPPLTMSRSFFCSNGTRSLIRAPRRRCAIGCRSAAFAACRWTWRRPTTPRSGDFSNDRQARSVDWALGQGQPAARSARLRHQARHGSSTRPSSPARSGALDVRGGVNSRDPDAHFTLAFPVSTKGSSRQTCDLGCLRRRCRRQAR